jgi:Ca-activated chloride channel homolog
MTFNPDDPKYTAYVLGELSDAERAEVDAEVQNDSRVAALVTEIQAMTLSLAQELNAEPLLALAKDQREKIVAAGNKPATVGKPNRRVAWAMAIGASLLLAAGSGWLLRGMNIASADHNVVSNSMKQIGVAQVNFEDKRSATAAADGVVALDASESMAASTDPQFRQGDISGPTPPFGGFTGYKADGSSQSGTLTTIAGTVGGQGVTNLALGTAPESHALTAGYSGAGTPIVNGGTQSRPLEISSGTAPLHVGNNTTLSTASVAGDKNRIPGYLYTDATYSLGISGSDKALPYYRGTTVNGGTLTLSGNNTWAAQGQNNLAIVTGADNRPGLAIANGTLNLASEGKDRAWGWRESNTESYDSLIENSFLAAADNPLSTFSIDVDTASYSNIRRFLLQQNQLPPAGAVRIEELINYFHYQYPQPEGERPFSVTTEVASCPWAAEHRLVRVGLKGREIPADKRPPTSLVFLIDVSGSMEQPNKLPLVQESLKLLTKQLTENDHVAIVVYAGNSGMVLPSTRGDKHEEIIAAIERLRAGGSTNGGQGIQLAYEIASQNFLKGGVNRVILATDGDFNVGITNQDELVRLIQEQAKTGVFLTTLGFGYGNLKDSTMQKLADKGNGNNYYIDDLPEARKVLVEQMGGTLVTIAKDVKIQIEFNPQEVAGYRLVGYEKRMLAKEDFNNDKIDAGEIGAGHTVTALYEIVPAEGNAKAEGGRPAAAGKLQAEEGGAKSGVGDGKPESEFQSVDALKYVKPAELTDAAKNGELFTLKLRYKQPDGEKSSLMETPVKDAGKKYGEASGDFKFAAAVASFGMILRDSQFKGNATLAAVQELAGEGLQKHDGGNNGADDAKENDERARRAEFIQLVELAKTLKGP